MTHQEFHENLVMEFRKCPQIVSEIIKSVIELIDPVRTKRTQLSHLEKTEKTYIGTKVEIILRYHLDVKRGLVQDCLLGDTEFDIKCTVGNNWMIPREAVNHFCLLIKIDWNLRKISVGTFLAAPEFLSQGTNQDQKRNISLIGKNTIKWIYRAEEFDIPNLVPYVEWRKAS